MRVAGVLQGRLRIPADVLVYSRAEVNQWGHQPGTALYWVLREGRVVHSRESLYKSLSGERAPSRDTLCSR